MEIFREIVEFIKNLYGADKIGLHEPVFFGKEREYLIKCIETSQVSYIGDFVKEFEKFLSSYTSSKYAIAVVNGTSGLHVALKAVGVSLGDEVITQPLTFVATVNAISYCGAHASFVDVDRDTFGLSPESLNHFLSKYVKYQNSELINRVTGRRIAAIVPVHVFGHPCRIDQIVEIAEKYGIPVVEDAAEALGSFYKGKHCGTFGRAGVFSFNGNKIVTTGGGGAVVTNDRELAERIYHLSTTAKIPHPYEYTHNEVGYNYRMPNINAALGVAQLECIESILTLKREIAREYREFFTSKEINFIDQPDQANSNFWLNGIIFKNHQERTGFLNFVSKEGIQCRGLWRLIINLPMYKDAFYDNLQNSRFLEERVVNIPSGIPRKRVKP